MQMLITHGSTARTRVLQFRRWQLLLAALGLVVALLALPYSGSTAAPANPLTMASDLWAASTSMPPMALPNSCDLLPIIP